VNRSGPWVIAVTAALAAGATPAGAQESQPRVRTVVRAEIAREVIRAVRTAIDPGTVVARARQNRQGRVEQTDRQTQTLALGASGLLELNNVSGDISVTAGSGRDVRIEIVRTSRARTDAEAKLGLDQVKVAVDHRGERATVRAVYPEQTRQSRQSQPYSVSITYTVTAPAATRVSITTVSGDVVVRDLKGDLSAEVVSGDITITGASQVTNVRAISGDVTLRDSGSASNLSAGTLSGTVLLERVKARRVGVDVTGGDIILRDVEAENAQLKTLSGDVEFAGSLARGGRYELQSHSGDVQLAAAGGAGFELQVQTFNGSIAAPDDGDFRNVTKSRRSLRGTVGDGSAIVTITTFSGDVTIVRK
jgi:DUF4097 and DUF4098 domain-containing protein YvlB